MSKTIDINIRKRADTKEAQDLKKMLESMENVEVKVNAEDSNIQKAQKDVDKLNGYTANINVDVEGDKEIDAVDKKIGTVNGKSVTIPVTVEGEEQLDAVDEKVGTVNGKSVTIPVTVEGEEQLDAVDEKIGQLNGKPVNIPVNTNSSSLDGLTNKIMGVAGGIAMADEATRMWTASTQRQSNEVYLASKMGTEKAKEMGSAIQKIVAQVPGDDTFMNTLLTGSLAKQTDLTTSQLKQQANVMADYLSMSQAQGKNALEAQQDLKSYILSGSTAELQRSSILSNQVDKLENQATIYDRIQALQKAMDAEGYSGFSGLETASLKMETILGGIEKGYADLGSMALPHIEGILDGVLSLDDATGGLFLDIVSGTKMAGASIVTVVSGFGEFHRGMQALKETKIGEWAGSVKDKLSSLATSARTTASSFATSLYNGLKTAAGAAKTAALELASLGKKVLLAGANALKTVAMWVAETAAKAASTVATTALAVAEWLLASPILLVVVALVALIAVLWYLYSTNETVRAAIDGFVQTLINGWNYIVTTVQSAVQSVILFFMNLYLNIVATGQWIWNSILTVLGFIASVPGRVWNYLLQIINRVIQFGSNVVNNIRNSATNAVNNFISGIASLPGRVYSELQKTLNRVIEWGTQIVGRLGEIAQKAWQAFVKGLGIGSPGYIQILTLKELEDTGKGIPDATHGIVDNLGKMAGEAVDAWGVPVFDYGFNNIKGNGAVDIDSVASNQDSRVEVLLNKILDALNEFEGNEPSMTFNLYGDMDEERKMQRFLDAVRKELAWNNSTAGRDIG